MTCQKTGQLVYSTHYEMGMDTRERGTFGDIKDSGHDSEPIKIELDQPFEAPGFSLRNLVKSDEYNPKD